MSIRAHELAARAAAANAKPDLRSGESPLLALNPTIRDLYEAAGAARMADRPDASNRLEELAAKMEAEEAARRWPAVDEAAAEYVKKVQERNRAKV